MLWTWTWVVTSYVAFATFSKKKVLCLLSVHQSRGQVADIIY